MAMPMVNGLGLLDVSAQVDPGQLSLDAAQFALRDGWAIRRQTRP